MFGYVVLLVSVMMNVAQGDTVGNSLVTCTACQAVQSKDFSCNVNCQVIKGNNDELVTNGVITDLQQHLKQMNTTVNTLLQKLEDEIANGAYLLQQLKQLNDTTQTADARIQKLNDTVKTADARLQKLEAPRDAFTATSFNNTLQNTAEADITVGTIYKFPTEVLDQLDSYDPATGIFTPQQNGTYSLLLAARSQPSSTAVLALFVEKANNDLHIVCKTNAYSEREDSTCSTLYELEVGDKVYPKGANLNGKMHMEAKFGSFQAYFVY